LDASFNDCPFIVSGVAHPAPPGQQAQFSRAQYHAFDDVSSMFSGCYEFVLIFLLFGHEIREVTAHKERNSSANSQQLVSFGNSLCL
jgi:hypothetical protein